MTAAARRQRPGKVGGTTASTFAETSSSVFATAARTAGQEPLATRYGHHIIRLNDKHPGQDLPFELVAGRIADYLGESVRHRATAQYIARLVSDARIEGLELAGREALHVQ